jgi:hypothetical protein
VQCNGFGHHWSTIQYWICQRREVVHGAKFHHQIRLIEHPQESLQNHRVVGHGVFLVNLHCEHLQILKDPEIPCLPKVVLPNRVVRLPASFCSPCTVHGARLLEPRSLNSMKPTLTQFQRMSSSSMGHRLRTGRSV